MTRAEQLQNIKALIQFNKDNPKGICYSRCHYVDVSRVVKMIEEIKIDNVLGADSEVNKFMIEFLSQSVFPGQ